MSRETLVLGGNHLIPVPRVLDYVIEILKGADRSLLAREICTDLQSKGVTIERTKLTQILWNQNSRSELVVDKNTFKWHYEPKAAREADEAESRKQENRKELANQAALTEIWNNLEFEFVGVRRKGTDRPLFFLREDGVRYWLVGPKGNVLWERSDKCSEPQLLHPTEFTPEQIKKAAEELMNEKRRKLIEHRQEICKSLRQTELLAPEVYLGPPMVRVEDVIPVSGGIFVATVSSLESCTLSLGVGTVLEPLYLVIDILETGTISDTRYGVFKICVYELIKRDLVVEVEGDLKLILNLENDRVYIGSGKHALHLV